MRHIDAVIELGRDDAAIMRCGLEAARLFLGLNHKLRLHSKINLGVLMCVCVCVFFFGPRYSPRLTSKRCVLIY